MSFSSSCIHVYIGQSSCRLGREISRQYEHLGLSESTQRIFCENHDASSSSSSSSSLSSSSSSSLSSVFVVDFGGRDSGRSSGCWSAGKNIDEVLCALRRALETCLTPALGITVVLSLEDGTATSIATNLLHTVSTDLPGLQLAAIGLLPLGGLSGMAYYNAVVGLQAALACAESLILRGFDDALYILAHEAKGAAGAGASATLQDMIAVTAADIVSASLSYSSTSFGSSSSSGSHVCMDSASDGFNGNDTDWRLRAWPFEAITTGRGKIFDIRSSLWRIFAQAGSGSGSGSAPARGGRREGVAHMQKKTSPLRDMSANLRSLHKTFTGRQEGAGAGSGVGAASGWAEDHQQYKQMAPISFESVDHGRAQLVEMRLSPFHSHSAHGMGQGQGQGHGVVRLYAGAASVSDSSASPTELTAAFVFATPGVLWPSVTHSIAHLQRAQRQHTIAALSCPKYSSSSSSSSSSARARDAPGPPDVVALSFQSPYAQHTVAYTCRRAEQLVRAGAYLHSFMGGESSAAEEISIAMEHVLALID